MKAIKMMENGEDEKMWRGHTTNIYKLHDGLYTS